MIKVLAMIAALSFTIAASANDGNSNNTIIIKPEINVKGCCASQPCKPKTKVVTKTVIVEKVVDKKVEVPVYIDRTETKVIVKRVHKKNRISLLGGMGPVKLDQVSPTQTNLDRGAIGGVMYQRSLTETLNIGIQGQTNQTVLGTVGFDF
jgi:hypothetical protein